MTDYRVTWEIDVDAENPWEAAKKAREMQQDPESTALVFDVRQIVRKPDPPVSVDLALDE